MLLSVSLTRFLKSSVTKCSMAAFDYLQNDRVAMGGPWHGGRRISVPMGQLRPRFACAGLYLIYQPSCPLQFRWAVEEYRHPFLSWQSTKIPHWSSRKWLFGSWRAEARRCVGIALLGESAFRLPQRVLCNNSLAAATLGRDTDVKQQCLVRSSRFAMVLRQILALRREDI